MAKPNGGRRLVIESTAQLQLGDLGFEGGLHQQLGAEAGHLLQDLRQRTVLGEKFIDVVADTVSGRNSARHGRGSFLRDLAVLKGNLRPSSHLHPILDATGGYSEGSNWVYLRLRLPCDSSGNPECY